MQFYGFFLNIVLIGCTCNRYLYLFYIAVKIFTPTFASKQILRFQKYLYSAQIRFDINIFYLAHVTKYSICFLFLRKSALIFFRLVILNVALLCLTCPRFCALMQVENPVLNLSWNWFFGAMLGARSNPQITSSGFCHVPLPPFQYGQM